MPSVCVNDCGLLVEGGSIGIDWDTLGVKSGSVTDDDAFSSGVPASTEGLERMRSIRTTFDNQTCRTHMIAWWAEIPNINANMVAGNYWDTALYTTGQVGSAPPLDSFSMSSAARFRLSHPGGTALFRLSTPLLTRRNRGLVGSGSTFHMLASFWRGILDRQDNFQNLLSWPSMSLKWEAWPVD